MAGRVHRVKARRQWALSMKVKGSSKRVTRLVNAPSLKRARANARGRHSVAMAVAYGGPTRAGSWGIRFQKASRARKIMAAKGKPFAPAKPRGYTPKRKGPKWGVPGVKTTRQRFTAKYMSDPDNHYPLPKDFFPKRNAARYAKLKARRQGISANGKPKVRRARDNSAIVRKGWQTRRRRGGFRSVYAAR